MKKIQLLTALCLATMCLAQNKEKYPSKHASFIKEEKIDAKDTFNFDEMQKLVQERGKPNDKVIINNQTNSYLLNYQEMTLITSFNSNKSKFDFITVINGNYIVAIYRNWVFEPATFNSVGNSTSPYLEKTSKLCLRLQKLLKN